VDLLHSRAPIFWHIRAAMSHENNAGIVEDDEAAEEVQGRRSWTPFVLLAAIAAVLTLGTGQVLKSNAEREAQAASVKAAQAKMDFVN
jgi:uncharacterized protein HemX